MQFCTANLAIFFKKFTNEQKYSKISSKVEIGPSRFKTDPPAIFGGRSIILDDFHRSHQDQPTQYSTDPSVKFSFESCIIFFSNFTTVRILNTVLIMYIYNYRQYEHSCNLLTEATRCINPGYCQVKVVSGEGRFVKQCVFIMLIVNCTTAY